MKGMILSVGIVLHLLLASQAQAASLTEDLKKLRRRVASEQNLRDPSVLNDQVEKTSLTCFGVHLPLWVSEALGFENVEKAKLQKRIEFNRIESTYESLSKAIHFLNGMRKIAGGENLSPAEQAAYDEFLSYFPRIESNKVYYARGIAEIDSKGIEGFLSEYDSSNLSGIDFWIHLNWALSDPLNELQVKEKLEGQNS